MILIGDQKNRSETLVTYTEIMMETLNDADGCHMMPVLRNLRELFLTLGII